MTASLNGELRQHDVGPVKEHHGPADSSAGAGARRRRELNPRYICDDVGPRTVTPDDGVIDLEARFPDGRLECDQRFGRDLRGLEPGLKLVRFVVLIIHGKLPGMDRHGHESIEGAGDAFDRTPSERPSPEGWSESALVCFLRHSAIGDDRGAWTDMDRHAQTCTDRHGHERTLEGCSRVLSFDQWSRGDSNPRPKTC